MHPNQLFDYFLNKATLSLIVSSISAISVTKLMSSTLKNSCVPFSREKKERHTYIHNRMPAILTKEQSDIWLSPLDLTKDQSDDILSSAPDGSLNIVRVSKDVNSPRNNRENLIYPLED